MAQNRPTGQVVAAARQLLTQKWWTTERSNYELVTSQYALDEAADGDSAVAHRRLESLKGIPTLPSGMRSWISPRKYCGKRSCRDQQASTPFTSRRLPITK